METSSAAKAQKRRIKRWHLVDGIAPQQLATALELPAAEIEAVIAEALQQPNVSRLRVELLAIPMAPFRHERISANLLTKVELRQIARWHFVDGVAAETVAAALGAPLAVIEARLESLRSQMAEHPEQSSCGTHYAWTGDIKILSPQHAHKVFCWHFVNEVPVASVAEALGVPVGLVFDEVQRLRALPETAQRTAETSKTKAVWLTLNKPFSKQLLYRICVNYFHGNKSIPTIAHELAQTPQNVCAIVEHCRNTNRIPAAASAIKRKKKAKKRSKKTVPASTSKQAAVSKPAVRVPTPAEITRELYVDGNWSIESIADHLGLEVPSVCNLLQPMVPPRPVAAALHRSQREAIRSAREDGDSFLSIAESLDVSLEEVFATVGRIEINDARAAWHSENYDDAEDEEGDDEYEPEPQIGDVFDVPNVENLGPDTYVPGKSDAALAAEVNEATARRLLNNWSAEGFARRSKLGSRATIHSIRSTWFWRIHTGVEVSKWIAERESSWSLDSSWTTRRRPDALGHFNGKKLEESYRLEAYTTIEGGEWKSTTSSYTTPTYSYTTENPVTYDYYGRAVSGGGVTYHTTGGETVSNTSHEYVGGHEVEHTREVLAAQTEFKSISHIETWNVGTDPLPSGLGSTANPYVLHYGQSNSHAVSADALTPGWPDHAKKVVADCLARLKAKVSGRPQGFDRFHFASLLHQVPVWTVEYSLGSGPKQTLWIYGTDHKVHAPSEPIGRQVYVWSAVLAVAAVAATVLLR